jgi:uncharacterized protein VirK/YbjX
MVQWTQISRPPFVDLWQENGRVIIGEQASDPFSLFHVLETNDDFTSSFEFNLYPNPNSGILSISYSLPKYAKSANLHIWSLTGASVFQTTLDANQKTKDINLLNQASGSYIATIVIDSEQVSSKVFILQK